MNDTTKPLQPHESTLTVESGSGNYKGDLYLWAGDDTEIGMVSSAAPGGAERWAKFFQAAPAMARALLKTGGVGQRAIQSPDEWHTHHCLEVREGDGIDECTQDCVETRAALAAAGVPLK